MAFTLDQIVPWGRSLEEYVGMFDLTEDDLKLRILGCGDGPASFNAEVHARGYYVVSVDPIYQFSAEQIETRVHAVYDEIITQLLANQDAFVWDMIRSPEELGKMRMSAMKEFLADFEQGKHEGRYQTAELPNLPFEDQEFDLVLCSHFLFLYTAHLSLDFHRQAILEMCRVAKEVRIFPLLDLETKKSAYVAALLAEMEENGFLADILNVPYEFQRGGNQMMRISNNR
jgi:SAM-dependent methyltransferase